MATTRNFHTQSPNSKKKKETNTTNSQSTANDTYRYTIGSEKGKDIAQNLSTGEKYQCSDGSVWTKQPDGSVSVNYNGQTYDNAYKPTSTGSGNSQYTNNSYTPTNNALSTYVGKGTYNDADLPNSALKEIATQKALYNQAMAAGNTEAANQAHAEAERIRAQYGYSGGEDGSEYIPLEQQIIPSAQSGGSAQSWGNSYIQSNPQPTYNSKYDPEIDKLLNEILNRDDFSYDAQNDPLYQQYAQMYQREGDRAMRETLAEVASGAGGMNTYAITAAQQAANRYASQLGDKIPELYQLAYEMYLADKESMVQDLGILQDMDTTQYNRYRDTMSDYKNDRNFAYGLYQDDVAQGNWQKTFDHNAMIDDRNFNYNSGWDSIKWNANQDQIALENSRYDKEQAQEEVWRYINMGITPGADLISRAGMDMTTVNLAVAAVQAQSSGNDGKKKIIDDEPTLEAEPDNSWTKGLTDLGLGLVYSPELLVELDELGAVYEENGKLKWADGWNAQNFQTKLNERKAYNSFLPTF